MASNQSPNKIIVEKNGKLYLPLLSPLSIKWPPSTWYTDIHLVWLHFKNTRKEKIIPSEIDVDNGLRTSNASPIVCLFQNKEMFLLKIILINFVTNLYNLSALSPFSSHLQVLRRWLLKANSTVLMLTFLPNVPKIAPTNPPVPESQFMWTHEIINRSFPSFQG